MGIGSLSQFKTVFFAIAVMFMLPLHSLSQIPSPAGVSNQGDLDHAANPNPVAVTLSPELEARGYWLKPEVYDEPESRRGQLDAERVMIVEEISAHVTEECYEKKDEALKCCSAEGALSCALGLKSERGSSINLILSSAQMFTTASSSALGVAGACKAMKANSFMSAGMNALVANSCGKKRAACEDTCRASEEYIQSNIKQHCQERDHPTRIIKRVYTMEPVGENGEEVASGVPPVVYLDTTNNLDYSPTCKAYKEFAGLYKDRRRECESFQQAEEQLRLQAMSSGISVALSAACEQQTAAVDPLSVDPAGDDICQDASNQTNPYCIVRNPQLCQLPVNSSNSACAGYGNNPNNPTTPGGSGPTLGPGSNTDGGIIGDIPDSFNQGYDGNGNSPTPDNGSLGLASVQGGGGSGAPGGAGGGGGSGTSGGGGYSGLSSGSRGYNTDILKGARGGSGYSVTPSKFKSGGGGFAGYGRGGAAKPTDDKKVNLKSYLPGAKNNPNRKFASIGKGEIGGKHGDIFKRVESKFNELCLFNRLVCDKSTRRVQKKK